MALYERRIIYPLCLIFILWYINKFRVVLITDNNRQLPSTTDNYRQQADNYRQQAHNYRQQADNYRQQAEKYRQQANIHTLIVFL